MAEGGGWGEEFRHARAEVKRFRQPAVGGTSKQNNFQFLLRKIWRAGVKKLKENCFALLAEFRLAETRSGANLAFFVQKRFELRSVIATIKHPDKSVGVFFIRGDANVRAQRLCLPADRRASQPKRKAGL